MNIKGILPSINSVQQPALAAKKAKVKSSGTDDDRDANGRREDQDDQQQHSPMTDEEAQSVLAAMKNLPGIKDNGLTIEITTNGAVKVALVKDYSGKIVRRIPEAGLCAFLRPKDESKQTGHLLDKAM